MIVVNKLIMSNFISETSQRGLRSSQKDKPFGTASSHADDEARQRKADLIAKVLKPKGDPFSSIKKASQTPRTQSQFAKFRKDVQLPGDLHMTP